MRMDGDVMRMKPVEGGLEIRPGATVELKPGGYHLMFMDLKEPLKEGETIKGTLVFEKAGSVEVEYAVRGMGGAASCRTQALAQERSHDPSNVLLVPLLVFTTGLLVLVVTAGLLLFPSGQQQSAGKVPIGGPFKLTSHEGKPFTEREPEGQALRGVLRLHPLPGGLPDDPLRSDPGHGGPGQGCRQAAGRLHHGRSGARHAGADEDLSLLLRSAHRRPDRHGGGDRRRCQGLQDLLPQGADRGRTTPWTTRRRCS